MPEIRFVDVAKVYPDGTRAVRDLDLTIADGELMVLVGPSGCGKSTALRLLAGLEAITGGEIWIGDRRVDLLPPQERDVAMVFQNYALYPHMTVRRNLAFPLEMMKVERREIERRVGEAARVLSLESLLDRRPANLSGGQRQRVAMGRALVREPAAFLLDEPLSNLDAKLRVQMRSEIAALQRRLGTTSLYVTHDQVEALTLGDRLAVLKAGVLQQVGTPTELFERPANTFVGTFIGSPSMNLVRARVREDGGAFQLATDGPWLPVGGAVRERYPSLPEHRGAEIVVGLRPEAFVPAADAPPERRLRARVEALEALGHEVIAYLELTASSAPVDDARDQAAAASEEDLAALEADATGTDLPRAVVAARLPPSLPLPRGGEIEVGVDTDQIYAFTPDGRALGSEEGAGEDRRAGRSSV